MKTFTAVYAVLALFATAQALPQGQPMPEPEMKVVKRQCQIAQNGTRVCNTTPRCHTNADGSQFCVASFEG